MPKTPRKSATSTLRGTLADRVINLARSPTAGSERLSDAEWDSTDKQRMFRHHEDPLAGGNPKDPTRQPAQREASLPPGP